MHSAPAPAPAPAPTPAPAPARPHAPCPMPLPLPLPLPLPVQVSRQAGRQASRQASRPAARQPSRQRLGSRLAPEAATVPSHPNPASSRQSGSHLDSDLPNQDRDCYLTRSGALGLTPDYPDQVHSDPAQVHLTSQSLGGSLAWSVEASALGGGSLARSVEASALGGALHCQQECDEISLAADSHTAVLARPLAPVRPHRGSEGFIYSGMIENESV